MKKLNKVLEYILAFLMIVMVVGCFWQIFTRFILNDPSSWTEELLRYALIWLTTLGVPYAYGKEQHIAIEFITNTFSKKGKLGDKILVEIIVLLLSVFVLLVGGIMVTKNASGQLSPAMGIPMEFYYLGIPICGALMILYSGQRLIRFVKELKETKKEGK